MLPIMYRLNKAWNEILNLPVKTLDLELLVEEENGRIIENLLIKQKRNPRKSRNDVKMIYFPPVNLIFNCMYMYIENKTTPEKFP